MNVLRDPRFRRLLIAETVSGFGDSAMFLSLGVWAKDLTGSSSAAGLVFFAITAPGLAAPLLGHLVDRVRRKPLLIWAYTLMGGVVLSLVAVHDRDELWLLYAVAVAYGLLFSLPARSALLKDLLPSAEAASARAALSSVNQGVRLVSPAVGAGMYAALGGGALAVLDAGTFAVAIAALAGLRVVESEPEPYVGRFRDQVLAGVRHVRSTHLLRQLTVAMTVFMAVIGLTETGTFAAIDHGLHRSAAFFGVLMSVQGAGSIVGGLLSGVAVRRFGAARTFGVAGLLAAAAATLFTTTSTPLYLCGGFAEGVAIPLLAVPVGVAQQLYTPSRLMGRVSAAMGVLFDSAQSVSIAAGAALVALVDYRLLFATITLVVLVDAGAVLLRPAAAPKVVASAADAVAAATTGSAATS